MRRMMVAVICRDRARVERGSGDGNTDARQGDGRPGEQHWPSSNGTYLAWTTCVNNTLNVYVKTLPDGAPERVNPAGTGAEKATFVGSSNVLVYEQWNVGTRGDIYFYDVSTGARTEAPAAVNKPRTWEFAPMASDNYILFMRRQVVQSGTLLRSWLLLYDRNSGVMTTLEDGLSKDYRPTFAGTTYVAWRCVVPWGCAIHYWSEEGGEQIQPASGAGISTPRGSTRRRSRSTSSGLEARRIQCASG